MRARLSGRARRFLFPISPSSGCRRDGRETATSRRPTRCDEPADSRSQRKEGGLFLRFLQPLPSFSVYASLACVRVISLAYLAFNPGVSESAFPLSSLGRPVTTAAAPSPPLVPLHVLSFMRLHRARLYATLRQSFSIFPSFLSFLFFLIVLTYIKRCNNLIIANTGEYEQIVENTGPVALSRIPPPLVAMERSFWWLHNVRKTIKIGCVTSEAVRFERDATESGLEESSVFQKE